MNQEATPLLIRIKEAVLDFGALIAIGIIVFIGFGIALGIVTNAVTTAEPSKLSVQRWMDHQYQVVCYIYDTQSVGNAMSCLYLP
jgi:hypothetical protein